MPVTPLVPDHIDAVLQLAQDAIGFEDAETATLAHAPGAGTWLVVTDQSKQVLASAYYKAEAMTDRAWNLLFLAVQPETQGQGCGTQLLEYIEAELARMIQRLLIVETLDIPEFAGAQKFYARRGFGQVATIPDYYYEGGGKIVYTKSLAVA